MFELVGLTEDGERVAVNVDNDDGEEEYKKKVMTIARQDLRIGCTACSKICPKNCHTHAPSFFGLKALLVSSSVGTGAVPV